VGVWGGGFASGALKFYTVETEEKGKFELHTWPIGFVDHALGLVGEMDKGLLVFQDLTNPRRVTPETGSTSSAEPSTTWTEFTLGTVDPATGEVSNELSFQASQNTRWTAWPGRVPNKNEWEIKWFQPSGMSSSPTLDCQPESKEVLPFEGS
jgi:hypothetical protein